MTDPFLLGFHPVAAVWTSHVEFHNYTPFVASALLGTHYRRESEIFQGGFPGKTGKLPEKGADNIRAWNRAGGNGFLLLLAEADRWEIIPNLAKKS